MSPMKFEPLWARRLEEQHRERLDEVPATIKPTECKACGEKLTPDGKPGRPKSYCDEECRDVGRRMRRSRTEAMCAACWRSWNRVLRRWRRWLRPGDVLANSAIIRWARRRAVRHA